MKISRIFLPVLFLSAAGLSQAEATVTVAAEASATKPIAPTEHQLNIVYFLGSDREPIAGYEERLSELMLYTQKFYAEQMERNGYGYRSFGMDMKNPERVNIIIYRADKPASAYPYENGGGWRAAQEVEKYLDAKGLRKSRHTLIIFPTIYDDKNTDMSPGGVPFYGLGKVACALDYAFFDLEHLGQNTPKGHLMTKWFGGLAHELGHGLNLPHNMAVGSEAELGTALMGAGNYTFGMKPTFITAGSSALLDRCEVFAPKGDKTVFYQGRLEPKLEKLDIKVVDGKTIEISGSVTSNLALAALNIYIEEPPLGVNRDYEAHVFTQKLKAVDSKTAQPFAQSIPISELVGQKSTERAVRLCFIAENGQQQTIIAPLNLEEKKD